MQQRIYRSNDNRVAFGVCGGIADRYQWDPLWIRLAFVTFTLLGGPGVLLYLILLLIVPRQPAMQSASYRALPTY